MAGIQGNKLGMALQAEGLVPPNCNFLELVVPVSGAVMLRFECVVQPADLDKIARALQAVAATP